MKFLIVKTSALGDIIHAFPIPAYLRQRFPESQIDWVVEKPFAELVRAHPFVENVHIINTKEWRRSLTSKVTFQEVRSFRQHLHKTHYDVLFDLQGNIKSSFATFQAHAKAKVGFSWQTVPEWPNILFTNHRYTPPQGGNIRNDYLFIVKKYFNDMFTEFSQGVTLQISEEDRNKLKTLLAHPYLQRNLKIIICPGSNWRNKQVTPEALRHFLVLMNQELECSFLFVWGTPEEQQLGKELELQFPHQSIVVDKMPLPLLQNLMKEVDLVIAMDSLPLHLAGTTETPTFSIFGASLADKYKPQGSQHVAMQGSCPYEKTFDKRCPILRTCSTGSCIRGLTGNEIFSYFKTFLRNSRVESWKRF